MDKASVKKIISSFSGILPFEKLMLFKNHRFVLPFWHAVSDEPLAHLSKLYQVPTVREFERSLDYLLKNYKPGNVDDLIRLSASRGKSEKKLFFPSFDDGLSLCYHVIAPILKRKGIQAAFFINPSFVGNYALFHRHKASLILSALEQKKSTPAEEKKAGQLLQNCFNNNNLYEFLHRTAYTDNWLLDQVGRIYEINFGDFLKTQQPYMSLEQISQLQADGFLIGAHGMDHREFYLSSEDEIKEQIFQSMEFVNKELHPAMKLFAFPYTDFNVPDTVFEWANSNEIWDLSFGTAGMKDERMLNHLQRIPMESSAGASCKKIIRTEYVWYYLKSVLGKNKVSRQ
jgi:peptidoglycan/xylan/chitin deacetylase (PgdA/CDA1 family)